MSTSAIVVLRRASQHGARDFLCSVRTWEFLSDLGQTFGWHPRGSTYVTTTRQTTPPSVGLRHNYQPGGMQDGKQIEAADATEWASALGIAKRSGHFGGMLRAHAALVNSAEEALRETVDEFIDFARIGAFVFSLCSEPDLLARSPSDNEGSAESHEREPA